MSLFENKKIKLKDDLTLYDICTKEVVSISIDSTLQEVISLMYKNGLRDIVITDNKNHPQGILTVSDIIKIQEISQMDSRLEDIPLLPCLIEHKDFCVKDIMSKYGMDFYYICLVDTYDDSELVGIVSKTDIIANYDPKVLAEYEQVSNLLNGQKINYVHYNMPTKEAISLLQDDLDDALIVVKDKKPIGIVTVRDVLKIFANNLPQDVEISNYMNSPLQTLPKTTTIKKALIFLKEKHFKRAIIEDDNGGILGIITQAELTRFLYNKWIELSRQNIDIAKEFEKIAKMDPLTRTYNRMKFDEVIESEESRIKRHNISFYSVVMVDIDNFKEINDTFGHTTGDNILKNFASVTEECIRKNDILFRWGGEEFIIFLPQTECKNAVVAAEKVRNLIESYNFEGPGRVTCSFGVSAKRDMQDSIENIVKRADEALYMAKRSGKNIVKSLC